MALLLICLRCRPGILAEHAAGEVLRYFIFDIKSLAVKEGSGLCQQSDCLNLLDISFVNVYGVPNVVVVL